jgi:hypothetical protein
MPKVTGQEFKAGQAFDIHGCQYFSAKILYPNSSEEFSAINGIDGTIYSQSIPFNYIENTTGTWIINSQDIICPANVLSALVSVTVDFDLLDGWLELRRTRLISGEQVTTLVYGPFGSDGVVSPVYLDVLPNDIINLVFCFLSKTDGYSLSDSFGDNMSRIQILYLS